MEGRLTGKVAIVTGAARGLGRSISLALAAEGADVVAADLASNTTTTTSYAMGSMDDLNETATMIQQKGRQGKAVRADVTRDADCRQLAEATIDSFGRVDILVSNAGIFSMGLAWELSEEQWDRVLAVNLKGAWLVTRHVVPHMLRQRSGKVVFTASTNGLKADTHFSHYCAAKHGLIGYMKALAIESGPYNINVNAVCPTNMETIGGRPDELHAIFARSADASAEDFARLTGEQNLFPDRGLLSPDDVARSVVFLVSEDARHLTGHALPVDAGWIVKRGG